NARRPPLSETVGRHGWRPPSLHGRIHGVSRKEGAALRSPRCPSRASEGRRGQAKPTAQRPRAAEDVPPPLRSRAAPRAASAPDPPHARDTPADDARSRDTSRRGPPDPHAPTTRRPYESSHSRESSLAITAHIPRRRPAFGRACLRPGI